MPTQVQRSLTPTQLDQFNHDGYLIVPDLLSRRLVKQVIGRFEPMFAGQFDTGTYPDEWHWNPYLGQPGASGQMTGIWKCDRTLASVLLSARLGQMAAAIGGWSGARVLMDDLWLKPPGAKATTLHQDAMYFTYHTPAESVTCWIALSNAVPGGSTIEYVPGSHRWPLATTVPEFHGSTRSYRWEMEQAAQRADVPHPNVLALDLKPGSCVFHHGHTWHGSGANVMPTAIRRSLVVSYVPAEARFKSTNTHVPDGYVPGKYKRHGDDSMDESFFPIVWREDGYRTPFLADYCADALAN